MKCTVHNQIQMTCSPGFGGNKANEYSEPLVIRFEQPWQGGLRGAGGSGQRWGECKHGIDLKRGNKQEGKKSYPDL